MTIQQAATGEWLQIKGAVKQQWGKLTNDDITEINGSREKLIGKLVSTYSMTKDKAQRDVDKFWSEVSRRASGAEH